MATQVSLVCHPSTPTDAVRTITARVSRAADGVLGLTFVLDGDMARIRVPAPRPSQLVHQLWEHTCLEAFVAAEGAAGYHELNLAPSGEWAGYQFRSYREIEALADESLAPRITLRSAADRLTLEASVALDRLSPAYAGVPLRLGLSAVIEATDGALSYWALRHPAGKPDFHHADALALRLEPSAGEW
jgi:hypothetical protein